MYPYTFLASASLIDTFNTLFGKAARGLQSIGISIGILALAIVGIRYMASSDSNKARQATDWLVKIIIGLVILICAKPIVEGLVVMFSEVR